jgi:hypothetical protein
MADPSYIVDGVLTDGEAWVGIAHASLSLPAAVCTFTSTDDGQTGDFSQYMDLVLIVYTRSAVSATSGGFYLHINNDTTAHYLNQYLWGTGAAVAAGSATTQTYVPLGDMPANTAGANIFGCAVCQLFDINSGKYKSALIQTAGDLDGSGFVQLRAATWPSQAPITELDISASADLMAGSKFSLFGVLPRMVTA